jgi:hypothetical protein
VALDLGDALAHPRVVADEVMTCLENYMEAKEISKGIQIEKEA